MSSWWMIIVDSSHITYGQTRLNDIMTAIYRFPSNSLNHIDRIVGMLSLNQATA
jgi:hypothetical protein